ncbi:MAG: hypothetical protein NUW09_02740, partial [Deltaproteobacteria bacterium]|nr:hypothetical protein [Deltaproteobacteria bacterium]
MDNEQVHGSLPEPEAMQTEVTENDGKAPIEGVEEEPSDPGQLEGKPKNQHEPPPESPRWKQVYKNWKDNERKVSELEAKLQEDRKDKEALSMQMKEILETVQAPKLEEPKVQPEQSLEADRSNTMRQIEDLKAKKREALKDMDMVTADEYNEQIDTLKDKLRQPAATPQDIDTVVSKREMERAVADFTSQAEWFNPESKKVNERMRAYAIYLENTMIPS